MVHMEAERFNFTACDFNMVAVYPEYHVYFALDNKELSCCAGTFIKISV